jgi:glycosyltransferase involved in cell wall biosynthesis
MIRVGLTEMHGIAKEVMANPPVGVEYVSIDNNPIILDKFITSPALGVLNYFPGEDCDIVEAPLFPILTNKPWVYTPARFSGATAFGLLGLPLPTSLRVFFIKQLMLRKNFIKLVFKSKAGIETLQSYAGITDQRIMAKVDFAYPCMRKVDESLIRYNEDDTVRFMFSGDFFLKGGANVVDAFIRLQKEFSGIELRICSDPSLRIKNISLQNRYKDLIQNTGGIKLGSVSRQEMLNSVLPETDVFVSPTYQEAFGFAILEASAYGIPVISTNHFAIPEIIEHSKSGFLIDTAFHPFIRNGKVCILDNIPKDFHEYMSEQVYKYMRLFLVERILIRKMGGAGLKISRSKFSFEERNKKMLAIYKAGLETV